MNLSAPPPRPAPSKPRRDNDLYPTPLPVCRAIVRELVELSILENGSTVVEPHVGTGNMVLALDQVAAEAGHRYHVTVHDISSTAPGLRLGRELTHLRVRVLPAGDWLTQGEKHGEWDLGLGNPPFAEVEEGKVRGRVVAIEHVEATRRLCRWTCFVLRDGLWTSSADPVRMAWATTQHPNYRLDLAPRPSFTGDDKRGQFGTCAAIWGPSRPPLWTQHKTIDCTRRGA